MEPNSPIRRNPNNRSLALDPKDLKILAIVQTSNLTPHREIGEAVGLSPPAVTRRLQRLRASGVIREDVSVVDGEAVGRPLTLIVEVVAHSEQLRQLDAMRQAFNTCRQIQHCYYVTGQADFILIFSVSDMAEFEKLTRRLFIECKNVQRFTTFVAMEVIKSSSRISL